MSSAGFKRPVLYNHINKKQNLKAFSMEFFNSAVGVLQTLVIALGAGLGVWGVINLLARLKKRSLSKKRNLALNEFALGVDSLERFVQGEPLYRVHECVFGVLALESEPVDPRL